MEKENDGADNVDKNGNENGDEDGNYENVDEDGKDDNVEENDGADKHSKEACRYDRRSQFLSIGGELCLASSLWAQTSLRLRE